MAFGPSTRISQFPVAWSVGKCVFGVRSSVSAQLSIAEILQFYCRGLSSAFYRRAVSRAVHEIFKRHTDLIEPLSLDEAYLDVTENKMRMLAPEFVQTRHGSSGERASANLS